MTGKRSIPNPLLARESALVEHMSAFRAGVHDRLLDALATRVLQEAVCHSSQASNASKELEATAQILRVLIKACWNDQDVARFDAYWREASRSEAFGDEFEAERFRIQHAIESARAALRLKEGENEEASRRGLRHEVTAVKLDKPPASCYEDPCFSQPTLFGMKTYHGSRTDQGPTVVVEENGTRRDLDPRFDLRNHSPTGVEWGYSGSGPAQLALALAADVLGDDDKAQTLYQQLKFKLIGGLPRDGWSLTEERIRAAAQAIEQDKGRTP